MTHEDRTEFTLLIGNLLEAYGREVTKGALQGYWLGLGDLEISELKRVITQAIRESEHVPTVAELRRMAGQQTTEERATIAWSHAERATSLGAYKHVDFEDKTINAVIRNLGGWPTFIARFAGVEEEKWLRLEFIKAYGNLSNCTGEICEPLAGLAEAEVLTVKSIETGEIESRRIHPIPRRIECNPSRIGIAGKQQRLVDHVA